MGGKVRKGRGYTTVTSCSPPGTDPPARRPPCSELCTQRESALQPLAPSLQGAGLERSTHSAARDNFRIWGLLTQGQELWCLLKADFKLSSFLPSPIAKSTQKQVPFQLPHAPWGAPCFFSSSEVACGSHICSQDGSCSQVPGSSQKFTHYQ